MIIKIVSLCCAVFSSLPVPFLPKIMPVSKPVVPPTVACAVAECASDTSANRIYEFDLDLETYELEEFVSGAVRQSKCEKNAIIYAKANKGANSNKTKNLLRRESVVRSAQIIN